MSHQNYRWSDLIDKYLKGELTDVEMNELIRQKMETPWKQEQFDHFATPKGIMTQIKSLDETNVDADWEKFKKQHIKPAHSIKAILFKLKAYPVQTMSAAAFVSVLLLGVFFFIQSIQNTDTRHLPSLVMNDTPYGNEALFILSDGTTIKLDSVRDGEQIAAGIPYIKKNTQILPSMMQNAAHRAANGVNILYVPAGRQYQLTLLDGTNIKVNAATRVYFPMSFPDNYRWVAIIGEAFFDVTKNPKKPFFINIRNKMRAEVFGTTFNITGYDDNDYIKTTLIDGDIKIAELDSLSGIIKTKKILAGQQAYWKNGLLRIINNVNLKQVTAWVHGEFNFEKKPIKEIMQEISHWYKVKIKYTGKIPDVTSTGVLPRSMLLSEIINILEGANQINIKETPDSTLIISPQTQSENITE